MRPLRLEIQGLTSFRAPQVIDLSGLDLFVITGPTGSGKTSILDAIALALYGEIPRTGKKNAAELVTHGESRARVLLEFQANSETYRVARQLPRNGAQRATLERRLASDDWVTDVEDSGVRPVNARIESIIGLDFEAFTRAVLLPQGDFAEFLSGDARQRREILVRLLDLGRYEKAGQLARQQAERLSNEISSKEQVIAHEYAGVSDATVVAATKEAMEAEERTALLERASAEIEQASEGLAEIQRRLQKIDEDGATLGQVGQALAELKEAWASLEPRVIDHQEAVRRASGDLEGAITAHRKAVANLEATRTRTGEESFLVGLEAACAGAVREAATLANLEAEIGSAQTKISASEEALAEAVAVLEKARVHDESACAAEEVLNAEASCFDDKMRRARDRADAERTAALATTDDARARAELESHNQALKEAEAEAALAADRLAHFTREHAAIAIRTGLTIGEPCPVCLQMVSEIPMSPAEVESTIIGAQADLDAARKRERSAQRQANEAASEASAAVRMLTEAIKTLNRLADAPALAEIETEATAFNKRRTDIRANRAEAARGVDSARACHTELTAKLAGAKAHLDGLVRERSGVRERLRTAQEQVETAFPTEKPEDAARVIAHRRHDLLTARQAEEATRAKIDRARDTHNNIEKLPEELDQKVTRLMQWCAEQRGVLSQLESNPGEIGAKLKEAQRPLSDEIVTLGDCARVAKAKNEQGREAEQKASTRHTADLATTAAAIGISLVSLDPIEIRAASQSAITEAARAAQRAANKLADLRARTQRRKELEEQIINLRDRERLYQALASELRQNRFIDYVLRESIRQLATLASQELRGISAERYSLSTDETSFVVVDHANADETRSVATLSGGETFLASLSLAMALGRSITDIAGDAIGSRLEAMFIDEGFGTLDSDTLDMVIDALERLCDAERMVGVITHVNQLAERIPDGLTIERDGATSRIRPR
jgi:exonuclease SbcC